MDTKRIAVIRIKGDVGITPKIRKTLELVHLFKKNSLVILHENQSTLGALKLLKDSVTWGYLDKNTAQLLLEKRGKIFGNKPLTSDYLNEKIRMTFDTFSENFMVGKAELKDIPGIKPFFRLNPPRKGFERKGTKKQYTQKGSLGERKEKINDLILRMI